MKSPRGRVDIPFGNKHSTKKHSASPLVDPAVCGLVVVAASDDDHTRKPTRIDDSYLRKTEALVAASQHIAVPVFICCRNTDLEVTVDTNRTFSCEGYGCIWKNDAFRKALDAEDLSALVFAGCWLDREVTVAALHALADCYDVYVSLDASPVRSRGAARLAEARLSQAGATPLLTEQILHEWIVETPDVAQRAALAALLK